MAMAMAAATCDKGFSCSYMILKPEEVRFFDLIHILFFSDIGKRDFVDSSGPDGTEESFHRRWLIFVSIVAQKFLQFVAKPLGFVGSVIETWLNLVSSNRSLGRLFLNLFQGQSSSCCAINSLLASLLYKHSTRYIYFYRSHV